MVLFFHKLGPVFNLSTSSVPSNRQHIAEADKVLVSFALTLKSATLPDGLWAIKSQN